MRTNAGPHPTVCLCPCVCVLCVCVCACGGAFQIRQVYSGRYLYVSTGEAARLDNLNMQVNLMDTPSKRT
jgi:hypothetical protein